MFKTPKLDYYNFAINLLPPTRRKPKWIAWIKGVISGIERLNKIFINYIKGTNILVWSSLTTYSIDNEVEYNKKIYKSLVNNNINQNPETNADKWQLILDSFIGIEESSRFCYMTLVLTYALNRYFQRELTLHGYVGFRQPDDPINPTNSDIYLGNVTPTFPTFLIGEIESLSDEIAETYSTGWITNDEEIVDASSYTFSVNIPSSVYSEINSDPTIAEKIVRRFLDNYIPLSIFYVIQTY